jgi:hypothetical protein
LKELMEVEKVPGEVARVLPGKGNTVLTNEMSVEIIPLYCYYN